MDEFAFKSKESSSVSDSGQEPARWYVHEPEDDDGPGWVIPPPPEGSANPAQAPSAPDLDLEISSFYTEHFPKLVTFLLFQGARHGDALDCAHDAIEKACEKWEVLYSPYSWCRTTALRSFWDLRRRQKREPVARVDHPFPFERSEDKDRGAGEALEELEQRHFLLDMSRRHLTPRQQIVVALTYDGATAAEIATDLGVEPATVRSTLRAAREVLRRVAGKDEL